MNKMPPLVNFLNPWALTLLALFIPLLLLYLLRPRPKKIKFPSLLFIHQIEQSKRFRSFFRRFIRDPLLLLQLFIFFFLILSLAKPYFFSSEISHPREKAVFIFDGSASMQSTEILPSRMEKSKELALSILKEMNEESKISLVFAEKAPILLLREASDKEVVEKVIRGLRAVDTSSKLDEAILFANDLLSGKDNFVKRIYLFSDFSHPGEIKLGESLSLQKGIEVKFIKVNQGGKNKGIIGINGGRFSNERNKCYLNFIVKNFVLEEEIAKIEIFMDGKLVKSLEEKIPANTSSFFYWKGSCSLEEHEMEVKMKEKDDLGLDNQAYWVIPGVKRYKLLLITNQEGYLKYALESSPDFSVKIATPPVIPDLKEGNFDVVILGNFDYGLILPGFFLELRNYLEGGGNLIILASEGLYHSKENLNLISLLPIDLKEIVTAKSVIKKERDHQILRDVVLDNVILERYIKTQRKSNSYKILATTKNFPLIVLGEKGKGKVIYLGINPEKEWSNFYLSSSLPVLWFQTINWMIEHPLSRKNYQSGEHIFLKGENIKTTTPSGKTLTDKEMILDKVGVYLLNSSQEIEKFSVNLEDEQESDISNSLEVETLNNQNFEIVRERHERKVFLWKYLLVLLLGLFFIEAILYRRRGLI